MYIYPGCWYLPCGYSSTGRPYGFWMRAAGEHPEALETAGVSPVKMKFLASILCGIFCGFAGGASVFRLSELLYRRHERESWFYCFCLCHLFGMANPPKVFGAAILFGFPASFGSAAAVSGCPVRLDGGGSISGYCSNAGIHHRDGESPERKRELKKRLCKKICLTRCR